MLNKISYTFIIGAGASKPYGFPLGDELYSNIQDGYYNKVLSYFENVGYHKSFEIEAFKYTEELKTTTAISIDKYLNINQKFRKHGIYSIITEILNNEKNSTLPLKKNNIEGDWYSYLYKKMIQDLDTIDYLMRFNDNKVSFITFNYDRSLEHFLFENLFGLLKNAGVTRSILASHFIKIPFIHVYGSIGYLPWQKDVFFDNEGYYFPERSILSYGHKDIHPLDAGVHLENMIEIMYDERKTKEEIQKARDLIEKSNRVLFLGFGYDERNLAILDIPNSLKEKRIFGTAYGHTKNEIMHIKNLLGLSSSTRNSDIYDCDCLMLLKEHLL